jgi:glycogen debranching enzyme
LLIRAPPVAMLVWCGLRCRLDYMEQQRPAGPHAPQPSNEEPLDGLLPAGEPMLIDDIREALLICEGDAFLLTDPEGNVAPHNRLGLGLYHHDARHLSGYRLTLNGTPLVLLLSTAEAGYAMEQVLTNPALARADGRRVERGTIEFRRLRVMSGGVEESLTVENFNHYAVTLSLLLELDADFADIFDVRGYERETAPQREAPVLERRAVRYACTGIDGVRRTTVVSFDQDPVVLDATTALFRMTLPARGEQSLRISVALTGAPAAPAPDVAELIGGLAASYREWCGQMTSIETDNAFVNQVVERSLRDLRMLSRPDGASGGYVAAGTPWFDTLFGRDSCILGMQAMSYDPGIARGVLTLLAGMQGTRIDPARDEEPGKILHERRVSELSSAGELPYGRYYGSVDSTPLFLMLLADYVAWTGDDGLVRELLPAVRAAYDWMRVYGGIDRDGLLSYEKRALRGLVNQGWKDSVDAVPHAGGELAQPPIALVEVQAYAYAACSRLAGVVERIGEPAFAEELRSTAAALRKRVNTDFWWREGGTYALALDGARRWQVRSLASNAGHALWCGIADPAQAEAVAATLMSPELFSGWGIRTLGSGHARFNPNGYHVGTVWPHDNGIIAMGMKMYGFDGALHRLARSLLDVATSYTYFRLPELFGGQARAEPWDPVPYAVACRPQAWAAGSFLMVMQALLGLHAESPGSVLRVVRPNLPDWLETVRVRNLRLGDGAVSLTFTRRGRETDVAVDSVQGKAKVAVVGRWPGIAH